MTGSGPHPAVAAALALALVAAGCLGGNPAGPQPGSAAQAPEDGGNTTAQGAQPAAAGENATLAEPPDWDAGDWWQVQVTSEVLGDTYKVRRVVAGTVDGDYRVGLAPFSNPVVFGHLPGVGNVRRSDLSFLVHGERFQPLDFPLKEGKTWTTTYLGTEYEATVNATDGTTATIRYEEVDGDGAMAAVYDARVGALTQIDGPLGTEVQVTDHGTNHTGEVVVSYDRAQRLDGRFAAAFDFGAEPAPPVGSLDVPGKYDRASVALLLGGFGGAPGVYREEATGPNGTSYAATSTGEAKIKLDLSRSPSGTWETRHAAGGAGYAATELILYRIQRVTLPRAPPGG